MFKTILFIEVEDINFYFPKGKEENKFEYEFTTPPKELFKINLN